MARDREGRRKKCREFKCGRIGKNIYSNPCPPSLPGWIAMGQIFPPSANTLFRTALVLAPVAALGAAYLAYMWTWSDSVTGANRSPGQPVPFSHKHHVSGLGLDCRYCHASVEQSAFADLPSTHTCMTCHSQVWTDAALLEPVRQSARTGIPVAWTRVYDLPGYVYFNHAIHVNKGVGCA